VNNVAQLMTSFFLLCSTLSSNSTNRFWNRCMLLLKGLYSISN